MLRKNENNKSTVHEYRFKHSKAMVAVMRSVESLYFFKQCLVTQSLGQSNIDVTFQLESCP